MKMVVEIFQDYFFLLLLPSDIFQNLMTAYTLKRHISFLLCSYFIKQD